LVVSKDRVKTIVQAKRHKSNIGNSAIQEIVAAKALYNADRCIVITNSHFTKNAITLVEANAVELWDMETLVANFKMELTK